MSLSPREAAETLGQIDRTAQRSAEAHEYANASPFFILWGVIWAIGYSGSHVLPAYGLRGAINWLWFALVVIGACANAFIGRRQYKAQHPGGRAEGRAKGLRWWATIVAFWLFIAATFMVLRPVNPVATGAFIPLLVALAYALFGIWRGLRFLYAGIAVAVLTLGGFFYLREFFLLWMAAVGGGSLILVGLWLKKI
jgi:hypothetical protein